MPDHRDVDEVLSLVKHLCTAEQIKALLRPRRGTEHVRISAENKDDLVDRNLRDAILAHAIDVQDVYDLIRDSEENGNQHIFFHKPKPRVAESLAYESVAEALFGKNWATAVKAFPSIKLRPNDFVVSDFRRIGQAKPRDWLLKVYGHTVISHATGKEEKRDGHIWREFKEEELRIVLSARWNSPDLFEIRVQRNESRRRVEQWQSQVWNALQRATAQEGFSPWILKTAMTRLVQEHPQHEKIYTFRDASIDDSGVRAEFQAHSDEGDLFASQRSIAAIESYLNADGECRGLTVTWLANPNGRPQEELKTLLAARESHEMIVAGHCTARDLDHVTDQLRTFNKRAS